VNCPSLLTHPQLADWLNLSSKDSSTAAKSNIPVCYLQVSPAHDEPNDSDPPPTGKPSAGRAPAEYWLPWAELLRRTVGVDLELTP
jgi:hypothetical protein